jgi:hypothetical protein
MEFDHDQYYYQTTLDENTLDFICKFGEFFQKVQEDPAYLKWSIIALHGSIYGLMCMALIKNDQSGIYKKEIRREDGIIPELKMIDVFNKDLKVDYFLELFENIKNDVLMKNNVNSNFFVDTNNTKEEMIKLNNYRNEFLHYKPICQSIEIKIFKVLIKKCIIVVNFLVFESNNIYTFSENNLKEIKDIIKNVESS